MKILLIEDDLDDIELLQEALLFRQVAFSLETVNDGGAAVQYIRNCQDCPDIIILDMNLPKVHGREVMLEIKSIASFKNIPLLVLTTSSAQQDIDYAYANGADKYLVKPTDITQINEMVDTIVRLSKPVKQ
jgi:DNA-binding response OmpR family regulator